MAAVVIVVVAGSASALDWPQWRGPDRNAISKETGLLQSWPEAGPKLVWKISGLGSGYSSVAVSGGRIYTMGDRGEACYLVALEESNGEEKWAVRVGPSRGGGNYPGPRCTPTVARGMVFAVGQFGDVLCARTDDGQVLWRKSFSADYRGKRDQNWGCSESPLVDGDQVILTPGGTLATMVALHRDTGNERWRCLVPGCGAGHSSAVIAEVGGIRHYVQLTTGGVIGVRASDGKLLWHYQKFLNNTANIPTCIVEGDEVFCSAGYENRSGGGALLKLVPEGDGIRVREIYFDPVLNNKHGGWVRVGDRLFGDRDDRGTIRCVQVKDGKVLWQRQGRRMGSASVIYADGRLYVRYQTGIVALVDPDADEYREVGSFRIPRSEMGPSWPHLVIANGKLYVREQDELFCYDIQNKGS
jgi:outer membrane protein assembly factor BamB